MKLLTVKTYTDLHEAHIDKGRLEADNIKVFLIDEMITQVYNFTPGFDGIKLQVVESDAAKALSILKNEEIIDISDAFNQVICPHCQSNNTTKIKSGLVFWFKSKYHCNQCQKKFKA